VVGQRRACLSDTKRSGTTEATWYDSRFSRAIAKNLTATCRVEAVMGKDDEGKRTEKTTGTDSEGHKFTAFVTKSDDPEANTQWAQGFGGSYGSHTTGHRDGSTWRTDSDGKREVPPPSISSDSSGGYSSK
jgi:hypothetical protein